MALNTRRGKVTTKTSRVVDNNNTAVGFVWSNAEAFDGLADFSDNEGFGIFIGGDGDVKVLMADGGTVTYKGLLAGTWLPISAVVLYVTGTTATNIIVGR